MKPISMILKIALLLSLCIPSTDIFAAGDDFCVKVEEKPSGSIIQTTPTLLCLNGHNGYTVPCFEVTEEQDSHINFASGYNFNITPVPDGTILELRAKIHTLDANGDPAYLALSNTTSGLTYVSGTSATVMNRWVDLSIDIYFEAIDDCLYYLTFWVANVTPTTPYTGPSGGSGGISQGPTGGTSFMVPSMELELPITKCEEACIITYPSIPPQCVSIDGPPNNDETHREFENNSFSSLSIYPNPTLDGHIVLDLDFGQSSVEKMDIQVLDTQGRVVYEANNLQKQAKQKLSLINLSPGIYFVYVKSGDQQLFEKIVKQ